MNFAKTVQLLSFLIFPVTVFAAGEINYGKANPPWKPGRRYAVKSQYEMELRNIVLEIHEIRPETKWRNEKETKHYESAPFTGTYSCYLDYATFGTHFANKKNGSTFRQYESADVEFRPLDETGRTVLTDAKPGWFRRTFHINPHSKAFANKEIGDAAENADFMFREVFQTDGEHLDSKSLYYLAWKELEAFNGDMRHHMTIRKREMSNGTKRTEEFDTLAHLSKHQRDQIEFGNRGEDVWNNWDEVSSQDVGFNVAQAEAKMMSYAIYGQQKTRNIGDVWTIDSETLESFFPLQSKKRKPFSFTGGIVVLTVESIDANGIVAVKSLLSGKVEGSTITTNLKVEPITDEYSEFKPDFKVDMGDSKSNLVRFTIDSRNEICLSAEMQILLQDYRGAIPRMEQLSLNESSKNRKMRANIKSGEIRLHCLISTQVEDME